MVSAGGAHTCALLADGSIECWGDNSAGQLGNSQTDSSSAPLAVSGISSATSVSAGSSHTCARLSDGTIRCWGNNSFGQLGNTPLPEGWTGGTIRNIPGSAVPVPVAGITDATTVSCFYCHCCALLSGGSLVCWGMDGQGQLGNPSVVTTCYDVAPPTGMEGAPTNAYEAQCSPVPVPVSDVDEVIGISVGFDATCALRWDGSVYCWGGNEWGQLGNGTSVDSATPVHVTGF